MKRFFMTLAAMLLLSIGAFAQIGATLKGDVNGDGKVDVEDVTSLVDIILTGKTYGYFYFGTTQPTAENYQMLSGLVASYTSINDAIGATSSIDAGEVLYMLCPATWTKGKKVVVEDGAGGSYNFIEDVDAETVSGYVIYRTEAWEEATDLTLNFEITGGDEYFWYVGIEQPTEVDSNWHTTTQDAGFSETVRLPAGTTWFAYPDTWTYTAVETSSGDEFSFNGFVNNTIKTSIPNYILCRKVLGASDDVTITFTK